LMLNNTRWHSSVGRATDL